MSNEITAKTIEAKILTIRNQQVMIDRDLAELYGTETKVLNQAVKRNIERFPEDFMFALDKAEKDELVTNCDRFKTMKHSSVMPYAFTEQKRYSGKISNHFVLCPAGATFASSWRKIKKFKKILDDKICTEYYVHWN